MPQGYSFVIGRSQVNITPATTREITTWNDSRIQALNSPEVAALLPGTPIKIVVEGYSSGYQTTFTYWLNATVSGWQVRVPQWLLLLLFFIIMGANVASRFRWAWGRV